MISQFSLWGMDAELKGNESRLMVRMPFFRSSGDPRIALALSQDWSIDAPGTLRWFDSEEEAAERGTKFTTSESAALPIVSYDIIAVIGTEMRRSLAAIGFDVPGWSMIQEGFMIQSMPIGEYWTLSASIADHGKKTFDGEYVASDGRELTAVAQAALVVMRGTSATKLDEQIVRSLIANELQEDTDAYRSTLELATIRLRESRETLEKWLRDYRNILFRRTKSLVLVGPSANANAAPDLSLVIAPEAGVAPRITAALGQLIVRLPQMVAESGDSTGSIGEQFQEFFDACGRFTNGLNSDTLGQAFGRVTAAQFDSTQFVHIWDSLQATVESDAAPTVKARRFPLYVLRGRTLSLAKHRWHQQEPLNKKLPALFGRVLETASRVSAATIGARICHLAPGESQFPEDRLFSALGTEAMAAIPDGIGWAPEPIQYGTLQGQSREADFAMTNEMFLAPEDAEALTPIFAHTGYFAFVARDWLERELGGPDAAKFTARQQKCLHGILSPSAAGLSEKQLLSARAWVALQARLPIYQNSEYREMTKRLTEWARRFGPVPTASLSTDDAFDDDFEDFVCGTQNAFIGGSIHARLLKRWYSRSGRFIELLAPRHFETLLQDIWPPKNRLRFGGRIREPLREPQRQKLRKALVQFHLDIAALLNVVARGTLSDKSLQSTIQHLMSILALTQENRGDARWSFVTDESDMQDLLIKDNTFILSTHPSDRRRM